MAPVEVSIDPGELALAVDDREKLHIVVTYEDGYSETIASEVRWESDARSIVEIDEHGEVRGRGVGTATVRAFFGELTGELAIEVYGEPKRLHLDSMKKDVPTGLTVQYLAELEYRHGERVDVTADVLWSTGADAIASIDAFGVVTGIAPGRTEVRASGFDLEETRELEVKPAVAVEVQTAPQTAMLTVGETLQLSASGLYSDGNTVDLTEDARWSSSLAQVASVDNRGLIEGKAPGQVFITAEKDGKHALVSVVVGPAPDVPE